MGGLPRSKCIHRIINRKVARYLLDRTDLLPPIEHIAHKMMSPGDPELAPLLANIFLQLIQDIETFDIEFEAEAKIEDDDLRR